jgi:hypothetical protein
LSQGTLNLISLDLAVQNQDVYGWRVFNNGKLFKVWVLIGTIDEMSFSDIPVAGTYYRVALVGNPDVTPLQQLLYRRVIALINPLYFGYPK